MDTKKNRFYYICFDVAGYDQHNAFTDNAYYFQIYLRDRIRIINSPESQSHIGYVDAPNVSDAIDGINKAEGENVITSMSEIQFLYLAYLDVPFAATADEMDIIDDVVSYDSSFDITAIAGNLFETIMRLTKTIDAICVDDEVKSTMHKFFQLVIWYVIMIYATSNSNTVGDCSMLPDAFVDQILENLPDREYETTIAMESALSYYNFIDYDYTYYQAIIGGNETGDAHLRESANLNTMWALNIDDAV